MAWSVDFTNANPSSFDPNFNQASPNYTRLINAVVARIEQEGKRVNPTFAFDINALRQGVVDWTTSGDQQKFLRAVEFGKRTLETLRDQSVEAADFDTFYQRYFFRQLSAQEKTQLKQQYKSQDYGFGFQAQLNVKQSALNRAINNGFLPQEASLNDFESFVSPDNQEAFTTKLLELNGSGTNAIIDPSIITQNPYGAAFVFDRLKTTNKLDFTQNGKYQWTTGNSWRNLKTFNNGGFLNDYQKLLVEYEDSDAYTQGQSLSQFIASKNRAAYDSIVEQVNATKQTLDTSQENLNQAKNTILEAFRTQLGSAISGITVGDINREAKIGALKKDIFQQVGDESRRQQYKEEMGANEIFATMNSMYQDMAAELGVKSDFLKPLGFNSNISQNWQNWFENELIKRYDPSNPNNVIGSLVGTSSEDVQLAVSFVQDYLQRRFDASKSLSEFLSYVNPADTNPVLETSATAEWNKYSSTALTKLGGSITDSNTVLGNFWTNLQAAWARGRGFNPEVYLQQPLSANQQSVFKVNDLHENLKQINNLAIQKQSTALTGDDLKSLDLIGVNKNDINALNDQANLYRQWFNVAYANGVDLTNAQEFTKLHYTTYLRDSSNPILQLQGGRTLNTNETGLITSEETQRLLKQVESLTEQAQGYADQIQYGVFKTPEEYVMELMNKSGVMDTSQFANLDLSDTLSSFINEYTGVVSSYAGELIRSQIRNLLNQNKTPTQEQLGIQYIERTKEQALSTIKNLMRQNLYTDAVVIDNAPGIKAGASLYDWFSNLGLELQPGKTWTDFKTQNMITSGQTFEEWEKTEGNTIDTATNKTKKQLFWEQWAKDNNIELVQTGDPSDPRLSLVVSNPTSAWINWSRQIEREAENQDITTKLNGAQVQVRTDKFNTDWYSKSNPYTKVKDDWNSIVTNPNRSIVDLKGNSLGEWAKENGLNAEEAWQLYREKQQETNSSFGKDLTGNDMNYISWIQKARASEIDQFWNESKSYWFEYLTNAGAIKAGTADDPKFKTWNEWAIEKNIPLTRISTSLASDEKPPSPFMELHYAAMGGKSKVDTEYLDLYFPEFGLLEQQNQLGSLTMQNSPFDLNQFGLNDIFDNEFGQTFTPYTATNRKSISPIDFAMNKMFGDTLSSDAASPFGDANLDLGTQDEFGITLNQSYNTGTQIRRRPNSFTGSSFGFGDFGGSTFGF